MGLIERISGETQAPAPSPPLSVSGRGHTDGFLQLEELNVDLQGRAGLEIYDRMFRTDGDVRQVVWLLANPIMAGTWEVQAAGGAMATQEAQDDAEFVRWSLFENMSPNLRGHLMECLPLLFRSGAVPFEKVWEAVEYEGSLVTVPRSMQVRLPRTIYRYKQDKFNQLEAIEQYLPVPRNVVVAGPNTSDIPGNPVQAGGVADVPDEGGNRQAVWLPAQNLLYYRVGAEGDNWEGVSLLRPAYKHWLIKDAVERMDAVAQEKEALGIPIAYPPLGATSDQLDALETILQGVRTNSQGYIVAPGPKATGTQSGPGFGQGWLFEYLEVKGGRDPGPILRYHTDKIAAAFIAEFIRLGHSLSGGARATAQVQQDPFLVGVEAFAGLIEDILNDQLVAPIMAYNRPKSKAIPRLRMSLVDATTLSQLADFILKLVQVGALLPDQVLEDFLRARADLPPADPKDVQNRGDLDSSLRREIVIGSMGGGGGDTAGTNGPAGSETGGSAPAAKGVDNRDKASSNGGAPPAAKASPSSAHEALTRKAISQTLSDSSGYPATSSRDRWRPTAWYELGVDLDGIEAHLDTAPQMMLDNCSLYMHQLARSMTEGYPKRVTDDKTLCDLMQGTLGRSYELGQRTAGEEMQRHMDGYSLSKVNDPRHRADVDTMAAAGHVQVLDAMHHAIASQHIHGTDAAAQQRAAERAGTATLKGVSRAHSVTAFNLGRTDRILDTAGDQSMPLNWGVRYTAILDRATCDNCREADDGVIRALDDPVRIERQPPNPTCDSVASATGNQCRCFEIPEPMPD